ncbi:ADP-ribosylation factor-like protein 6 isoform X1 [Musca domestica]|uniref:ADP-ribosylation factor-like protein 6 n=1 Tax=Musca domestica TaxID=7370 RepID=A0A9J7DH69_MUSDO|nr:ADP-ribosylation factor-like protein 6 isoform X1 [Musca domestica]
MGMFNNFLSLIKINKEKMTVLVVGLNNSGKSSIIQQFKRKNDTNSYISIPTVGFTHEEFYSKHKNPNKNHTKVNIKKITFFYSGQGVQFSVIDMSGAWKYRNLWQHQFKNCQGLIYVIDASDKMRMVVVKEELDILLQHPDLVNRSIPILFYGNKSDCDNSLSSVNIASALELTSICDKPWHICCCSAKTGDGLEEGVQWLIQQIRNLTHKKDKHKKK